MNEKEIEQKIIEEIKAKHIEPKPKWQFILEHFLIWVLFVLLIFIGSLMFSTIFFIILHSEKAIPIMRLGLLKRIFLNIPYFWIFLFSIFLFLAYVNFKHTKKGYRFSGYLIISLIFLISVLFGILAHGAGMGARIEGATFRKFPPYRKIMEFQGFGEQAPFNRFERFERKRIPRRIIR